jgi:hypothetical protein
VVRWLVAAVAVLLSGMSVFVVVQGANDEPYAVYRRYDVVVQVGVGTAVAVLWGCFLAGIVGLMVWRKVSWRWAGLVMWGVVCLFYLQTAVVGYLEDLERFVVRSEVGRVVPASAFSDKEGKLAAYPLGSSSPLAFC